MFSHPKPIDITLGVNLVLHELVLQSHNLAEDAFYALSDEDQLGLYQEAGKVFFGDSSLFTIEQGAQPTAAHRKIYEQMQHPAHRRELKDIETRDNLGKPLPEQEVIVKAYVNHVIKTKAAKDAKDAQKIPSGEYHLRGFVGRTKVNYMSSFITGSQTPEWKHCEYKSSVTVTAISIHEQILDINAHPVREGSPKAGIKEPYKLRMKINSDAKESYISSLSIVTGRFESSIINYDLKEMGLDNQHIPVQLERSSDGSSIALSGQIELGSLHLQSAALTKVLGLFSYPIELSGTLVKKEDSPSQRSPK